MVVMQKCWKSVWKRVFRYSFKKFLNAKFFFSYLLLFSLFHFWASYPARLTCIFNVVIIKKQRKRCPSPASLLCYAPLRSGQGFLVYQQPNFKKIFICWNIKKLPAQISIINIAVVLYIITITFDIKCS